MCKFASDSLTTAFLKLRLQATFDFSTFSAPLRAPEAAGQMQERRHAQRILGVHVTQAAAAAYVRRSIALGRTRSQRST